YAACNCDNSSYNALQAKVQKRVSSGLDLLLTYTFSKAMTNSEGGYGYSDNLNIRGVHGPAGWDHTHALTLTHSYDLPVGRGRRWASAANRFLDAMVGGWRFNGLTARPRPVPSRPGPGQRVRHSRGEDARVPLGKLQRAQPYQPWAAGRHRG